MPLSNKAVAWAAFAVLAIALATLPIAAQENPAQAQGQEPVKDPVERFIETAWTALKAIEIPPACGLRAGQDNSALFLYGECAARDGSRTEELLDEIERASLTIENAEARATKTVAKAKRFGVIADTRAQNGELAVVESDRAEKEKIALSGLANAIHATQPPNTLRKKAMQYQSGFRLSVLQLGGRKTLAAYVYAPGEKGVRRYALTSSIHVADLVAATPEQLAEFAKRIYSDAEAYLDTLSK